MNDDKVKMMKDLLASLNALKAVLKTEDEDFIEMACDKAADKAKEFWELMTEVD